MPDQTVTLIFNFFVIVYKDIIICLHPLVNTFIRNNKKLFLYIQPSNLTYKTTSPLTDPSNSTTLHNLPDQNLSHQNPKLHLKKTDHTLYH